MKNTSVFQNGEQANNSGVTIDQPTWQLPVEPLRGSVVVLIWQLVIFLLLTDAIYVIINTFLMRAYFLKLTLPFELHHMIILLLAFLHIIKSIFQIFFIVVTVLNWIGKSFYIVEKHLIKHQGIMSKKEKIYDLNNIRSVTVKQTLLGKLFHFGDVIIETSASGGYKDKIFVSGIADPDNFEAKLRHC